MAAEARSIATVPGDPIARFWLRLAGGVVEVCGGAIARGFTPIELLSTIGIVGLLLVTGGAQYAGRRRWWTRFARR